MSKRKAKMIENARKELAKRESNSSSTTIAEIKDAPSFTAAFSLMFISIFAALMLWSYGQRFLAIGIGITFIPIASFRFMKASNARYNKSKLQD